MTSKQIFNKVVIMGVEQNLNDYAQNFKWSTDNETLWGTLCDQLVKAMGIPRRYLFNDK